VLRLARLVALLTRINREARRLVVRHRLHYAVLITGVVVLAAAGTVFLVEERGGGTIDSFGDALWWAATTVTTVGYGDTFPVTPAGRGIAVALMIAGIAFFSLLTANIAAFFVERTPGDNAESTKLDEILQRLDAIEAQLRERRPS
jgi:voltage-gated potassium channel